MEADVDPVPDEADVLATLIELRREHQALKQLTARLAVAFSAYVSDEERAKIAELLAQANVDMKALI